MLTLAVWIWSLSTFVTPFFAKSIPALILLRVLLGFGEGLGRWEIFERCHFLGVDAMFCIAFLLVVNYVMSCVN